MTQALKATLKTQKLVWQHWYNNYWELVENGLSIFKSWAPEFYAYAIRGAKNVCYSRIFDYKDETFANWAIGESLAYFRSAWDSIPRQREFVFEQAMASVNLSGILLSVKCPPDQLEDVKQDVSIKVWLAFNRYDPRRAQFLTWVTTIARNSVADLYRKDVRSHKVQWQQLPLDECMQVADEEGAIGILMDALGELEREGELVTVQAIWDYLNGKVTELPDISLLRTTVLDLEGLHV